MVGKRRSRGAVVIMDETMKVKVQYIGVALVLCNLWEARNRDRFGMRSWNVSEGKQYSNKICAGPL